MLESLNLNVKGNSYTIDFPNVGQFQRIESMKQVLSNGMYASLMQMPTVASLEALDMYDIEAYLTVLAPQLVKDLKCNSFGELGMQDYLELKAIYKEKFLPWYSDIMDLLQPQTK